MKKIIFIYSIDFIKVPLFNIINRIDTFKAKVK